MCVFSDSDCVNVIHRGSIVGSPAYVPRTNGQLKLPIRTQDVLTARTSFAKDLAKGDTGPRQFMFDSAQVTATETDPGAGEAGRDALPYSSEDVVNPTSTLDYWDLELPQDVCASGRARSFGKGSKPVVAGSSSPFVSGGVWYYRVRGVNFSLPGTAPAMTWSARSRSGSPSRPSRS